MRAPVEAQQRFHRYVAVLFAVTFPTLAVLEIAGMDMKSPLAPIRWASYLVLAIWAIWLTQRRDADSMLLVLTTIWFFGTLSVVEGLFHIEVSAFDFTTTFGLIMMLAVLAGTLSSGSRVVWSVAAGVAVAVWSVTMGVLDTEKVEVVAIRAVTALAGVVFTTALVSKLYDQLSESISRYEKATRLQHAIATCSESLLVQTDTFAIYEALKALLVATEADYTYVDRNTVVDDEVHWEIIADAHRKAQGAAGGWKDGVYREESSTYRALAAGRAMAIHTDQLTGEDRAEYARDGIVTELTVPIFVGDEFRGSIGFVEYTDDRQWTEDEVATLWRASHMIGAYWRRQDDQEQLRASNDSKDKLLASVSHEIRTPLTAIVGLSEEIVASRTSLGGEELDELNGIIAVQSRELAELVEDLLVASRAEFGNLSIKPQDMSLMTEVESVVRGIRESHPTDKVIAVGGDSDVVAWADPLRCRQVIRNLLTNAIRYGGTRIAVVVRRLGDLAQVVVIDDGDGVSEAEAELIFERYYRSDQSPTQPGSVGIGLAVSRQLAEMMGGTLRYVGADGEPRFELSLPVGASLDAVSTAELSVTA
ncbi:MAG: HAMP domain-containing sensor histidine kinase [Acidimicrobiia bacterium]